MVLLAVSEAARERETFKYHSLDETTPAFNDPSCPIPASQLSSGLDPGLTVFAQLGCYRLNTTRILISLFDRQRQHIVAESTRTSPIRPNTRNTDNQLWLCGTSVPRSFGICDHVLFESSETASPTAEDRQDDLPVSVVPDLEKDDRFCHQPWIRGAPYNRFYAGVPIRSPKGIHIGVYCMFDQTPRDSLTKEEMQFMRDMSYNIMSYLEAKRRTQQNRRADRMVRGLGGFFSGADSLDIGTPSVAVRSGYFPSVEATLATRISRQVQPIDTNLPHDPPDGSTAVLSPVDLDSPGATHRDTDNVQGVDIQLVFSKAANIIRESLNVDGVLFLDANVRSYGGLVGSNIPVAPILGEPPSSGSSGDDSLSSDSREGERRCCSVLGYSTEFNSSLKSGDSTELVGLPERTLQKILSKYSQGLILTYDANGKEISTGSDSSGTDHSTTAAQSSTQSAGNPRKPLVRRNTARSGIAAQLIQICTGARSIGAVPLYDPQKNRWFGGGFLWTRTPNRVFSAEDELSYMRVFGLASMAEVARLTTKDTDRAKSDILGSLSHEIRSPLHGVMGAVELLRGTILDDFQEDLLQTIEMSGRTLLDVIDHLLDYSKSDKFWSSKSRRKSSGILSSGRGLKSTMAPARLDLLAEDVIEAVFAGFSYNSLADTSFKGRHPPLMTKTGHAQLGADATMQDYTGGSGAVQILLDIAAAPSWTFSAHPGSFRRIVMNLFGNSLKFTKTGFIKVKLSQEPLSKKLPDMGSKVILTVSDSGKGIGGTFLRGSLFTAFAKEDQFSPGSGLGLSLVRQMTESLGGSIKVDSVVGKGTTFVVSLPLAKISDANVADREDAFLKNKALLAGCKIAIRHSNASSDNETPAQLPEKSSLHILETICRDWLKMEVSHTEEPSVQFRLYEDSSLAAAEAEMEAIATPTVFLIVSRSPLPQNASRTPEMKGFVVVEYLSQPIGPRKFAKILVSSLKKLHEVQVTLNENPPQRSETCVGEAPAPKLAAGAESPRPDQTTGSLSVLVVDDNPVNLKLLGAYMKKLKLPSVTAADGLEGLETFTANPSAFSCIITDISMPVLDGLQFSRRVRELERERLLKPVVIIALSGLSSDEVKNEAFGSGINMFLQRPVMLKDVAEALERTEVK